MNHHPIGDKIFWTQLPNFLPSDRVQALKAQVASATGIRVLEQRLLWGNAEVLTSLEEREKGEDK